MNLIDAYCNSFRANEANISHKKAQSKQVSLSGRGVEGAAKIATRLSSDRRFTVDLLPPSSGNNRNLL
jgi:hypothetical protein